MKNKEVFIILKKFFPILAIGLAIFLAACGSENGSESANSGGSDGDGGKLEELREKGTVTVGFANEKPYAYEEEGELKGAAVDIAKAVFAELGIDNMDAKLADFSHDNLPYLLHHHSKHKENPVMCTEYR